MTDLSAAIRQKRFKIKDESIIPLLIDMCTGTTHEFELVNCSINGLGAIRYLGDHIRDEGDFFQPGFVVPRSKIIVGDQEIALGRLTVKYNRKAVDKRHAHIGFLAIDTKLPVDGILSRHLAHSKTRQFNPYDYELNSDTFSLATFIRNRDTNIDLFSRRRKFQVFYRDWAQTAKYNYCEVREPPTGARVHLRTPRKNGRTDYIQMAAYDYLNLGTHPKVVEAATDAVKRYGYNSGGSPVICGTTSLHQELAEKLARMLGKD
jgi:hypothetical protein